MLRNKNNSINVLKTRIANIVGQGLGTLASLILTIYCVKKMGLHDFGEFRYAMTVLPLVMCFGIPGYDSVILSETSRRTKVALLYVAISKTSAAAFFSIASFIYYYYYFKSSSVSSNYFLICIMTALPVYETLNFYKGFLIGRKLIQQAVFLQLASRAASVLIFAGGAFALAWLKCDSKWMFPTWLVAMSLPNLIILLRIFMVKRNGKIFLRRSISKGVNPLKKALITTVTGVITTTAYSADKILLKSVLGVEQLAYYSILVMLPQEIGKYADSFIVLSYNRIFGDKKIKENNFGKTKKIIVITSLVFVTVFSPIFYLSSGFLFGESYQYPLSYIILGACFALSSAVDFYYQHKILNKYGTVWAFVFSVANIAICALTYYYSIVFFKIPGLLVAVLIRSLLVGTAFGYIYVKSVK